MRTTFVRRRGGTLPESTQPEAVATARADFLTLRAISLALSALALGWGAFLWLKTWTLGWPDSHWNGMVGAELALSAVPILPVLVACSIALWWLARRTAGQLGLPARAGALALVACLIAIGAWVAWLVAWQLSPPSG
jgi:hypothetical protein